MKKLILISALLFSFNGWGDDDLPADGSFISYYQNGQIKLTGKVLDRKKTGIWEYYYENGQLQQKEKYRNGEPVGAWKSFNLEGKLIGEYWYGNGIKGSNINNKERNHNHGSIKTKPPK